jgi:hypothetical protein
MLDYWMVDVKTSNGYSNVHLTKDQTPRFFYHNGIDIKYTVFVYKLAYDGVEGCTHSF